jgi:hypothetical protein
MKRFVALMAVVMSVSAFAADAPSREPVEATTVGGDKVLLYPNGRWEFVEVKKAEAARKVAEAYPENQSAPAAATQGGLFGIGRTLKPGDKDYNRGSLNPKLH